MTIIYKKNIPYIEGQNLSDLTRLFKTPFYVYSQKKITDNFVKLKKSLNTDIYFSIKANSNQSIITLLNLLGAGSDVVSIEEMKRALSAGVSPDKIIFEGVGKTESDIEFAINKKIKQINVESIEELKRIISISNLLNKKTSIGIRINPNIKTNKIDKISTGSKTDKFGIDFDKLNEVCKILKSQKKIRFSGITCHAGSQIFDIKIFEKIFRKMKKAVKIFQLNNLQIKNLDLGGGFGVPYNKTQSKLNINKLAILMNKFFKNEPYKISFEPGRYLVANAGFLITKIITSKQNSNIKFLITDAGMQTFLRPALYNIEHKIIPFNRKGEETKYTIAGPICESSDILARNIKLPSQTTNNFLIINDVGAYGSVMSSNYNSKCLPNELIVHKNKFALIREGDKINKIIKKDKLPNWLIKN